MKKMVIYYRIVQLLLLFSCVVPAVAGAATIPGSIAVTGYFRNAENQGLSALDLASAIVGQGVQISNVTANCADYAAGTYTVSGDVGIGMPMGIILSTGLVANVVGPNKYAGISANNKKGGDADLNALIPGKNTLDACLLEFDFVPQNPNISFKYVFASEEYNEYVGSQYNDVFGFFVDGVNCATINEANVSVNSVNAGQNSGQFSDNTVTAANPEATYNIEMDGLTRVLTCSSPVIAGTTHHLKLAIADAGDSIWDSNVFIGSQSLISAQHGVALTPDNQQHMASCGSSTPYTLVLQNSGAVADSFNLTITGNVWPTVFDASGTGTLTVGPLEPLATATFTATVSIPEGVCTGHDAATVTATSVGAPDVFIVSTLASTADRRRVVDVSAVNMQTGSGLVVNKSPASPVIACPGTCTANYPYGTLVELSAVPSWHSSGLWTGCDSLIGMACSVTMISDFGLTAEFLPFLTVLRSGLTSGEYNTIQSAYDDSAGGDMLFIQEVASQTFQENLTLNLPIAVALVGGRDGAYQPAAGYTVVKGSIKISAGKVTVERIIIR